MAHTSRMDESDKCATKGFASLRKDFFDSLTGSYVDISFKTMGVMSVLMALLVAPLFYLRYTTGGTESLYRGLTYLAPSFLVVYFIGYYWVYQNVYTPVHEISTRLLAEQQSIDAWPDEDEVRGKDILDWQYKEIEALLEAIIDLQKRADKLGRGELNVAEMRREVEQGRTFVDAAESVAEETDREGEMIETFQGMALAMRKLAYQARLIADGDLANEALNEEIEGDLGQAFQDMVGNLKEFVAEVLEGVHEARSVSTEVDQAAEELNKASQELSSGAQESASSLEETSSSVEEIASMVEQSSENANRCETLSEEAVEAAQKGKDRIDSMASTMETINEDSDKIAEAIEVIDDIAFQTNLLALNAAVEAANAGEHGEGFAVVAEEVRELAQRSSDAAEEISEVIEESTERVEEGTRQAENSREVLDEINEKISEVRERVQEVNAAQKEQSSGIDEINRAVTELESVTEQNTANADETASASDELASQSRNLERTVERLSNVAGQFEIDRGVTGGKGSVGANTTASRKTNGNRADAANPEEAHKDEAEDVIPLEEDNPNF